MPRLLAIGPVCMLALACAENHEPTATSDRVELTTEVVPRVCGGTLEHIDEELARIEAELALGPSSEPFQLHVVDEQHIGEYCGSQHLCIVQPPRRLYITPALYERHLRFELVRDRLARTSVSASKPLFYEGLAAALTWPGCEPSELLEPLGSGAWNPPSVSQLLTTSSRGPLGDEGRYLGGELVRWLLDTRGPEALLGFMASIERNEGADATRVAYLDWAGSSIDTDLFAHWRPDDAPVDPGRAGCLSPAAPLGDAPSRISLAATLDCDSPRVRNDFVDPSRVFIEWTIDVPQGRDGVWRLVEALPEGVTVTASNCGCVNEAWALFAPVQVEEPWPEDGARWFDAERYRVRVYGPIGAELDITLQGPCDFAAQDCAAGQQCTNLGTCLAQVDEPAQLGEPCWPALAYDEHPLPCEAGLTCMGSLGGDGVCMHACDYVDDQWTCPDPLTCLDGLACTDVCDPFAPTCPDGSNCSPNVETGLGGCVPSTSSLALLEPCSWFDYACGPGLVCDSIPELEGCHDADSWFDFSGCCTPLCDPAAMAPGCPPELPNCEPLGEAGLGTCQPAPP
jgi:hypothetical protein